MPRAPLDDGVLVDNPQRDLGHTPTLGLDHVVQRQVRQRRQDRLAHRRRGIAERLVDVLRPGLDGVWLPRGEVADGHRDVDARFRQLGPCKCRHQERQVFIAKLARDAGELRQAEDGGAVQLARDVERGVVFPARESVGDDFRHDGAVRPNDTFFAHHVALHQTLDAHVVVRVALLRARAELLVQVLVVCRRHGGRRRRGGVLRRGPFQRRAELLRRRHELQSDVADDVEEFRGVGWVRGFGEVYPKSTFLRQTTDDFRSQSLGLRVQAKRRLERLVRGSVPRSRLLFGRCGVRRELPPQLGEQMLARSRHLRRKNGGAFGCGAAARSVGAEDVADKRC
mmetsp:Transcript_8478/g.27903  ORF Transcript_8478/g.27903 Transcript_8478/m.27903 type:complete len:339 (+) Transcript_8478:822-1838(+)